MSIQEKLDKLFERWKAVQQEQGEALGLAHPDWFFPDGLVGDEATWLNAPTRVLYLLKEGNLTEPPKDFDFWFKRIVADGTAHVIKKRIQLMQREIAGSDDLSVTAYMNLSKCGGKSVTDFNWLQSYANHPAIAPLIKEQIEILAPHVIICCGCYGLVSGILGGDAPYRLIDMWHPSDYFKSDEVYMAHFKKQNGEG